MLAFISKQADVDQNGFSSFFESEKVLDLLKKRKADGRDGWRWRITLLVLREREREIERERRIEEREYKTMSGGGGGGGGGGKRVRSLLKEALKCLSVGHGSKDGAQEACDLCIQILKTKEGRDNVDALLVLGKATFLLEEYDKSIKSYKKAAELKPSHLQAWKGILEVCERGKDEGSDLAALKREALVQLYEETKNERTSASSKYHAQYLQQVLVPDLLRSESSTTATATAATEEEEEEEEGLQARFERALGVCKQLIESDVSQETEVESLKTAVKLADKLEEWTLVHQNQNHQDFDMPLMVKLLVSFPPVMPVSRSLRKHVLRLVHRYPWLDGAWLDVARVVLDNQKRRRLTSPSTSPALKTAPGVNVARPLVPKMRTKVQAQARLEPENWKVWMLLGQLLAQKDPEKALRCVDKSLAFVAADAKEKGRGKNSASQLIVSFARLFKGMLLQQTGKFQQAAKILSALVSCDSDSDSDVAAISTGAEAVLGNVLVKMGSWEKVERHSRDLLSRLPNYHQALSNLGWACHKQKEKAPVSTDSSDSSSDSTAAKFLQDAIAAAGSTGEAASWHEDAIAEHHYRLGRVYWAMGGKFKSGREFSYSNFLRAASSGDIAVQSKSFRSLGDFYLHVLQSVKPEEEQKSQTNRKRALKCYSKALELDPTREGAGRQACALMQEDGNQVEELVELCTTSLERAPQVIWALKPLALALAKTRQYEQALPVFRKAIRSDDSKCRQCWEGLAVCYQQTKRYESAIRAYEHVVQLHPSHCTFSLIQLGTIHSDFLLDHRRALEMFTKAMEISSSKEVSAVAGACRSLLHLSRKNSKIGAYGSAANFASEALEILEGGEGGDLLKAKSALLYWKLCGDLRVELLNNESTPANLRASLSKLATRAYSKVLHMTPFVSKCWHDIAITMSCDSEMAPVSRAITNGLAINSNDAALWAALGITLKKLKLKEYCLARSLQLEPTNADTWVCLASLYLKEGVFGLARQCLQTARMYRPGCSSAWECEGVLRCLEDEKFNAAEIFEYALRLGNSSFANKHYAFETLLLQDVDTLPGNVESAWAAIQISMHIDASDDPLCHLCSGLILEHFQSHEEAIDMYQKSLDLAAGNKKLQEVVRANLARVLLKSRRLGEALELYDGLAASPDFVWDSTSRFAHEYTKVSSHAGAPQHDSKIATDGDEDIESFHAKAQLRNLLLGGLTIQDGVKYAIDQQSTNQQVAMECWLMLLTFAVKSRVQPEEMDLLLNHLRGSAVWDEIRIEATKILALRYLSSGDRKQASRCLARIVSIFSSLPPPFLLHLTRTFPFH